MATSTESVYAVAPHVATATLLVLSSPDSCPPSLPSPPALSVVKLESSATEPLPYQTPPSARLARLHSLPRPSATLDPATALTAGMLTLPEPRSPRQLAAGPAVPLPGHTTLAISAPPSLSSDVPASLADNSHQVKTSFSVMPIEQRRALAEERAQEAKRTSESTERAAQRARANGYVHPRRRAQSPAESQSRVQPCSATSPPPSPHAAVPMRPDLVKAEQARLLTLLRSLQPITVVDQLLKALSFFGGIPDAPPPLDGSFPLSAGNNGTGALFVGWLSEIFPRLGGNQTLQPQQDTGGPGQQQLDLEEKARRSRGRPKGSKTRRDQDPAANIAPAQAVGLQQDKSTPSQTHPSWTTPSTGLASGANGTTAATNNDQSKGHDLQHQGAQRNGDGENHLDDVDANVMLLAHAADPLQQPAETKVEATLSATTAARTTFSGASAAKDASQESPAGKRRGRPKGSKNRPKDASALGSRAPPDPSFDSQARPGQEDAPEAVAGDGTTPKRKPGRPKGSKTRPRTSDGGPSPTSGDISGLLAASQLPTQSAAVSVASPTVPTPASSSTGPKRKKQAGLDGAESSGQAADYGFHASPTVPPSEQQSILDSSSQAMQGGQPPTKRQRQSIDENARQSLVDAAVVVQGTCASEAAPAEATTQFVMGPPAIPSIQSPHQAHFTTPSPTMANFEAQLQLQAQIEGQQENLEHEQEQQQKQQQQQSQPQQPLHPLRGQQASITQTRPSILHQQSPNSGTASPRLPPQSLGASQTLYSPSYRPSNNTQYAQPVQPQQRQAAQQPYPGQHTTSSSHIAMVAPPQPYVTTPQHPLSSQDRRLQQQYQQAQPHHQQQHPDQGQASTRTVSSFAPRPPSFFPTPANSSFSAADTSNYRTPPTNTYGARNQSLPPAAPTFRSVNASMARPMAPSFGVPSPQRSAAQTTIAGATLQSFGSPSDWTMFGGASHHLDTSSSFDVSRASSNPVAGAFAGNSIGNGFETTTTNLHSGGRFYGIGRR